MNLVVRLVIGLIGLFFLIFGLRFVFTPDVMAAEFFLSPLGVAGLSNLRSDLGGAFLAIAVFIALGLRAGATVWLHAAAIAIATIAVARAVGMVLDGPAESVIIAFVAEVVFVALLLIGGRRLAASGNS
jgi:hypothetical protein